MATVAKTHVIATGALNEIRMIILGRTGTGKSAFGNTILGQEIFPHDSNGDSVTIECTPRTREFDGKRLFVVDTPGFLDTYMPEEKLHTEISKSYQMTARPGPHVFFIVLDPMARYTPQEYAAFSCVTDIFGSKVVDHTIIIFTNSDRLSQDGKTIEEYLNKLKGGPEHPLNKLLDRFERRYLAVNNRGTPEEKNSVVKTLIHMINEMLVKNGGQVYTNAAFEKLAREIEAAVSQGTYKPFNADGSFALLPQTKAIVIDGYIKRMSNRRT
ncbi:unnamed protein product [Rotaria sp. Silwood2]|nr:unnamed protein product [Rotaria sp. Silwood2]CAF3184745.1 unnamed protein product [Rotaria sp. Silwood2]CAF3525703.1 unnamed protein product [Rotaria sp. Silwood2]CAF4552441.1 unnamed protein product [Rotaria sp. Silwood2]CAF4570220.1 unnamed protein product [Rotaria sp. Silwood2]